MIICIIYNEIYLLFFDKYFMWKKHTFITAKGCIICAIWIFSVIIKDDAVPSYDNFFKVVLASMLHKKVLFITLCDIMPLALFFVDEKRQRLGKKFFYANFRFFTPFAAMIFDEFKWKRLIASQRRCWSKKEEHLEICCF